MIPIKINKEKLDTYNLDELEYKYLVEIPQDIRDKCERFRDNYGDDDVDDNKLLSLFTYNDFEVFRYIGKIGESNLFISEGDLYTADKDKDFLCHNGGNGDDMGFILTDEVLKDMVGKRFECDWRGRGYVSKILEKYHNKEIGIGDFIQRFLAYGFKKEVEKMKEYEKKKIDKEEKIKGNKLEIEEFNKGEWKEDSNTYASGNTIHCYSGDYIFNKDFNKLFTIEELNNSCSRYRYGANILNWIELLSIENNASYKFVSKDKKKTYNVVFKKDKMYVDKVLVPKVRSAFFISRASGDTEKLETLKELSAIKVQFLALTSISLNMPSYTYRNIPIEIKYADKLFEVTLLDKTINVGWKDLELFRHSIQSLKYSFYSSDIKSILELFDISKADMFDFMKKTQILDKLGEGDDE